MARQWFDGEHKTSRGQQLSLDWRGRRVGSDHVVECVGNYLAQQQTPNRRVDGWPARRARAGASGIYRLAHQRLAFAADAAVHGDFGARLVYLQRKVALTSDRVVMVSLNVTALQVILRLRSREDFRR